MATRNQRIVLETAANRIFGDLTLPEEGYRNRLSDYLNRQDVIFIPLSEVEVEPIGDEDAKRRLAFLAVSRAKVELAYELDE